MQKGSRCNVVARSSKEPLEEKSIHRPEEELERPVPAVDLSRLGVAHSIYSENRVCIFYVAYVYLWHSPGAVNANVVAIISFNARRHFVPDVNIVDGPLT